MTTIIPDMDPTRPAKVDPRRLLAAMRDWQVGQSFGSPAIWNRVGLHCEQTGERIATLRRVLSAGAPVPAHVLERMQRCLGEGAEIHTPYGATEALPVASIAASEVLGETQARTRTGAGVCVGRRFARMRWKVIRIVDGPIARLADAQELAAGEIGELIVSGPVVTREYVTRTQWNALAKIADGEQFWHRMGDAGYLDAQDRFWYCGRMAHRVLTSRGTLYSAPCEAIFETHPAVYRAALVGVGLAGSQRPVIVVECWPERRPQGAVRWWHFRPNWQRLPARTRRPRRSRISWCIRPCPSTSGTTPRSFANSSPLGLPRNWAIAGPGHDHARHGRRRIPRAVRR